MSAQLTRQQQATADAATSHQRPAVTTAARQVDHLQHAAQQLFVQHNKDLTRVAARSREAEAAEQTRSQIRGALQLAQQRRAVLEATLEERVQALDANQAELQRIVAATESTAAKRAQVVHAMAAATAVATPMRDAAERYGGDVQEQLVRARKLLDGKSPAEWKNATTALRRQRDILARTLEASTATTVADAEELLRSAATMVPGLTCAVPPTLLGDAELRALGPEGAARYCEEVLVALCDDSDVFAGTADVVAAAAAAAMTTLGAADAEAAAEAEWAAAAALQRDGAAAAESVARFDVQGEERAAFVQLADAHLEALTAAMMARSATVAELHAAAQADVAAAERVTCAAGEREAAHTAFVTASADAAREACDAIAAHGRAAASADEATAALRTAATALAAEAAGAIAATANDLDGTTTATAAAAACIAQAMVLREAAGSPDTLRVALAAMA